MGVLDLRESGRRLRPARHYGAQIQTQDRMSKSMLQNRIKYAVLVCERRRGDVKQKRREMGVILPGDRPERVLSHWEA
jgi:hypothetical protein